MSTYTIGTYVGYNPYEGPCCGYGCEITPTITLCDKCPGKYYIVENQTTVHCDQCNAHSEFQHCGKCNTHHSEQSLKHYCEICKVCTYHGDDKPHCRKCDMHHDAITVTYCGKCNRCILENKPHCDNCDKHHHASLKNTCSKCKNCCKGGLCSRCYKSQLLI
jgi:hypothetical protein